MSAVLSICGRHRLALWRDVQPQGRVALFVGVNPSTADHETNDHTVTKWIGFSKVLGLRGFWVGNLCSFRSTDVTALANNPEASRLQVANMLHLERMAGRADFIVPCWGANAKLPCELAHLRSLALSVLQASGKPLLCFGLTKDGGPRHPLMLAYSTPLVPFLCVQ